MIPTPGNPVPEGAVRLHGEFMKAFPEAEVAYASDLLAAARVLFGRKPGIAVILGTGSNSCEYDGTQIVKNVRSGGFPSSGMRAAEPVWAGSSFQTS